MTYSNSDRRRLLSERFRKCFVSIALSFSVFSAFVKLVRGGRSTLFRPESPIENRQVKGGAIYKWEYHTYKVLVSCFPAVLSAYAILAPSRETNNWFVFSHEGWDDWMNWLWVFVLGMYVIFILGILGIAARATDDNKRDADGRRAYIRVGCGAFLLVVLYFLSNLIDIFFGEDAIGTAAVTALVIGILSTAFGKYFFKLRPHTIREA